MGEQLEPAQAAGQYLPLPSVAAEEAQVVAEEAYIFGYPLVLMAVTLGVTPAGLYATSNAAPINRFVHSEMFPDPSFTDAVSPNADTLYSTARLDLTQGPIVLSVPDMGDRYYMMPMLDGWTNVFASPGSRTTGNGEGHFAVVGPGWSGTLPQGVEPIYSPTTMVWVIGRTKTSGKADYATVHAIQRQYRLTPLSVWGTSYAPPQDVPVTSRVAHRTPPVEQVAGMDATAFFDSLVALMASNPPSAADAPVLERMAKIGIAPGQRFDSNILQPAVAEAISRALPAAQARIAGAQKQLGDAIVNGWFMSADLGQYGTDYLKRACVALVGLGANLPEDAIYPHTAVDSAGQPLSGEHRYVLRFEAGRLPPVTGFWSLTMYNNRQFFVENPLDRYAIRDRDQLRISLDGSLELYIQHDSPGGERESNWLPAPQDGFNLVLRLYWPSREILRGIWMPPAVQRVG